MRELKSRINVDNFDTHLTIGCKAAFIGSDSVLVAPVRIGDHAYIAAGSTITENVPSDGLAIARGRQVNKPGWATKKRRELAAEEKPKNSMRRHAKKKPQRKKKKRR